MTHSSSPPRTAGTTPVRRVKLTNKKSVLAADGYKDGEGRCFEILSEMWFLKT